MSKEWKQISGDMTWEKHGALFARDDGKGWVEVWKFDCWAEHDPDAIATHGLYIYDEGSYHYDDLAQGLSVEQILADKKLAKEIKSICSTVGMDLEEYVDLPPSGKAEVMVSTHGCGGNSSSTSDLLEALPAKPEDIEFWGGPETTKKVQEYNRDDRRDAVRDHLGGSMSAGEWPDEETVEFAFGDEEDFDMKLGQSDGQAFDYAMVMAGVKGYSAPEVSIDKSHFKKVVMALWEAPGGEGMSKSQLAKAANCLGMEDEDDEAVAEKTSELCEEAQSLASSMMDTLGFEWI